MKEEKVNKVVSNFEEKYRAWLKSQKEQTSAYDYEKSFVDFMQQVSRDTLSVTTSSEGKSRNSKKKIQTTVGELEISKKNVLSQPSGPFRISPFLQTKLCYVGQKEIFAEGADSLKELGGIEITAKQIERVSHYWGEEIGIIEEKRALNQLERPKGLHYVMVDGAMILSREDSWKETKLGRIFPVTALYSLGNEENRRGWIRTSNYTGHIGNCHDFFDKFSPKVDLLADFICIGDGAKWIWDWCETNYPTAPRILDYWHATEHMWKFIKLLYTSKKRQETWIKEQEILLWEDGIEKVIENIKQISTRKLKAKEAQQKILTYLTNNKDKMKYKTYKDNGWLIGSGAIEAAHRTVIQKRLKLSGQRWTLPGAQQILNLRVVHKNNNWENLIHTIATAC